MLMHEAPKIGSVLSHLILKNQIIKLLIDTQSVALKAITTHAPIHGLQVTRKL